MLIQANSVGELGGVQNCLSLYFPGEVTGGSGLVVLANQGDGQESPPLGLSCTDLLGNDFINVGTAGLPGTPRYTTLFYCPGCSGGTDCVTITNYGASGLTMSMAIAEFSGGLVLDSGVLAERTGTGYGVNWSTGTVTTTVDTVLLVGGITAAFDGLTVNSPFHVLGSISGDFTAFCLDLTVTSPPFFPTPTALAASGTMLPSNYNDWAALLCGFKAP